MSPQKPRRSGFSLVLLYLALQGGFVVLHVVRPDLMAQRVRDTVSLAVVYGLLLIVGAVVIAMLHLTDDNAVS